MTNKEKVLQLFPKAICISNRGNNSWMQFFLGTAPFIVLLTTHYQGMTCALFASAGGNSSQRAWSNALWSITGLPASASKGEIDERWARMLKSKKEGC